MQHHVLYSRFWYLLENMRQQLDLDIVQAEFQRFLAGEELGFRQVFDRYQQILYRYALSVSRCDFEAEEVVQEAFIQLFKGRHQLNTYAQIYPYLFVIVKRMVIANFRKKVVQAKYQKHIGQDWDEGCMATQQGLELNELNGLLQTAMDNLSPKEQEAFRLNKLQGLSYDDISAHTGTSRHTVKNQIIAASKKIRLQLEKYYFLFFFFFLLF